MTAATSGGRERFPKAKGSGSPPDANEWNGVLPVSASSKSRNSPGRMARVASGVLQELPLHPLSPHGAIAAPLLELITPAAVRPSYLLREYAPN